MMDAFDSLWTLITLIELELIFRSHWTVINVVGRLFLNVHSFLAVRYFHLFMDVADSA